MKKLLLAVLILCFASSAFAGLGDGLKKVLICVPNDRTYTGSIQLIVSGAIVQGGGTYEVYNYSITSDTTGSSAALSTNLRARVATGRFGLIVVICRDSDYLYQNVLSHGWGRMAKYCSIEQYPLGVPTLVLAQNRLERGTYSGAGTFRNGCAAASDWSYAGAYDSLRCMTAEGDEVIWFNGTSSTRQRKHTLDINQTPESNYPWTVDYWPKSGTSTVHGGQDKTMYVWHVHSTAYDAAQLPGAGQDSVIYYFPEWESGLPSSVDKIKPLSALLKKYGCINYHPWSIYIDDWGYNLTGHMGDTASVNIALRADTLMDWLSANGIYAQFNTQYGAADFTQWPNGMSPYYQSQYIAFGWHPSNMYRLPKGTNTINPTYTWPSELNGEIDSLYHTYAYDWGLLESEGYHAYMELADEVCPGGGFRGAPGAADFTDSIMACFAAVGANAFRIEGASVSGYVGTMNIFYPHSGYPINLAAAGPSQSGWKGVDFEYVNYGLMGITNGTSRTSTDTLYASPSLMHDSTIVVGNALCNEVFYRYFTSLLLGNRREKDGGGAGWDETAPAQWAGAYNGECRGIVLAGHQYDTAVRTGRVSPTNPDGEWYNTLLLWLQHYYANLDAYNDMARDDDPTVGDVFRCMYLHEQPQRTNDRM